MSSRAIHGERWLTFEKAAWAFQIPVDRLHRLVAKGKARVNTIGHVKLVNTADLAELYPPPDGYIPPPAAVQEARPEPTVVASINAAIDVEAALGNTGSAYQPNQAEDFLQQELAAAGGAALHLKYQYLHDAFGLRRGWLDAAVMGDALKRYPDGTYDGAGVLRCMQRDPERVRVRKDQWR